MAGDFQFGVKDTPEYVRACCEASLKRLDVKYIDLYYQHRVDTLMGELKKLVEEGKIKYIRLSEAIAYSPLGHGFFGGKATVESLPIGSLLCGHPRFIDENVEKNKVIYARLANLAAKHACTPAQLALAWLLHQGEDILPIPGTTKIENLDANIGSLAVKLSKEDVKAISAAVPTHEVAGEREHSSTSKYAWNFANTPPK
ncbi:hypothetical protein L484_013326 [Morus notabilis]|uniref:NADP-dependent oxidoreductase domain-containing protein n=1 Tax=Morus notabilis TaxID=981085 RepID=W9SM17_9ROSA|nr:hypothetical protein L484_013326 [Morus notabilis]